LTQVEGRSKLTELNIVKPYNTMRYP